MTTPAAQCPYHGNSETRSDDAASVPGSSDQARTTASQDAADYAVADWVDVAELASDPYPTYARLRAESPVAWVPQLNKFLVTNYAGFLAPKLALVSNIGLMIAILLWRPAGLFSNARR